MRCLPLLLSLLAWMQLVLAQNLTLQSAVKQLPQCAQLCLEGAVQQSSCKPTDAACICMDKELQLNVEACVLQACTLRQALTTKNATATVCHAPVRDSGNTVRVNNILLAVITVAIALIRLIYKAAFSIGELGWDDYTLFATLLCGAPSVIIIDRFALPNGLGRDVWTVGFDQITEFVKYLYVLEILYFLQISLLKLTLLFFFLRIFPNKTTKRLLWATVAFNCLNGVAFVVTAIFQCYPISFYWTKWDGEGTGKCVNVNALAWANAIITIALDIWMLVLPLHQVFQLQLSWRKKFGVTIMFCVGTFVTVISILRLRSLVTFAASNNPTWDQTAVVNWSNFEMNIGIICACLPALRVILVRMFPKILGTTRASEQPYYGTGSQSRATKRSGIASASRAEKSYTSSKSNPTAITYTKTFDVQHSDSDEQSLVNVEMSRLAHKKQSPSSSTSISSV